ncbi:unnamed protein product [Blepharisma stoltei]|uniref:Uncharacterized protein n=1 Tax=Blepharisma stoltei TaxID=1481888 RepID=A0AAU9K323_9CILI|nr:unnamed protein product [Blepharisma stoltei]
MDSSGSSSPKSSKNHFLMLKFLRFGFSIILLSILFIGIFQNSLHFFIYLTNWGLTLTALYFVVSSISYYYSKYMPISVILFETVWCIGWCIFVVFWGVVGPLKGHHVIADVLLHILPIVLVIIDFLLNEILMTRKHAIFPIGVSIIYLVFINIPYSIAIHEVYPLMNYKNIWTYLILFLSLSVQVFSLEIGIWIKRRQIGNQRILELELENAKVVSTSPSVA